MLTTLYGRAGACSRRTESYTYDAIGNPLTCHNASGQGYEFTWTMGRRLKALTQGDETTTYNYIYNGDKLVQMTADGHTLYFSYDAMGTPLSVNFDGTEYFYVTNIQGDVTSIVDSTGTIVVTYRYNVWGVPEWSDGTTNTTLKTLNPLRYRGYVYDEETGLYYLQSRYYNPTWCRFLNADALVSTGQGILGNNMLAYCHNNPVLYVDPSGCVIVLADNTTDEQRAKYERAIAYLKKSPTGEKLISFLESSQETITIVVDKRLGSHYNYDNNIIYFDTNFGIILGDRYSVISPALLLAHEMGHAVQDIIGLIDLVDENENILESLNLLHIEKPIAKELREPCRYYYEDTWALGWAEDVTYSRTSPIRQWVQAFAFLMHPIAEFAKYWRI